MNACPNFSDPNIKASWDAIVKDPDLGRIEAMREFLLAERENRPMDGPEGVKARLARTEKAPSKVDQDVRIHKERDVILNKSNDPVYDDPDTLTGQAVIANPINGQNLSIKSTSNTRAMEVARKLSENLGIEFSFVSPEEAVEITANSKNPYNITKGPAFFYGNSVYFVGQGLTTEIAFHEFSHPVVRAIQTNNPVLFEKLFNDAIAADRTLLQEAYAEYKDLNDTVQAETDPDARLALEQKYQRAVAEEVVVKALTRSSITQQENRPLTTGLEKVVKDILYAIKQLLRKVFGQKINIAKLTADTTLDQLAEMLVEGGQFDITTENVQQSDVVSYIGTTSDIIQEMKNITEDGKKQQLLSLISKMYEGASQQVRLIIKNKNYSEMINLFADEYNRGDLQEIRSNVAPYANDLVNKTDKLANEIEETNKEIQALVTSMLRLEVMMEKMSKHLRELAQDPNNQDNLHKAYYYSHVLNYWQKYVKEAKEEMRIMGSVPGSEMNQLLNRIAGHMDNSADIITDMSQKGVKEVLWEQWSDMATRADELFDKSIKSLKEKKASQAAIDRAFLDYHGLTESQYSKFKNLSDKKEKDTLKSYEDITEFDSLQKQSFTGKRITKDKVERALRGEGTDANWYNSYLEGYIYNTDPVIGGFAMYFKNNMTEMEARAQAKYNDAVNELKPLLDAAGISFARIGALGEKIGFVDKIGIFDQETKTFGTKEVWTLLNPYKDYRYDIDKFQYEIKELEKRYNTTGTKEDRDLLASKVADFAAHQRKYFHQEYVDSFYDKDILLEKDEVGRNASFERKKILDRIKELTAMPDDGVVDNAELIKAEWKKYKLLYSLFNLNGEKKTGDDLIMAERLQEHRDLTRSFYEFKPRAGVFQNALSNFEDALFEKLKTQNYIPHSEPFNTEFEKQRQNWIDMNTRIVIKPEFYAKRGAILARIKAITSKLPSAQANEIDFSEYWKQILDVVSGYRDDDGQPMGSEMTDGRKAKVKEAQEAMERAKEKWAGFSGLTTDQMDMLVNLAAKKNSGIKLSPEEWETYRNLLDLQKTTGLDEYERAELNSLFAELKELQRKEPTEYYVDAINHWLEILGPENAFYKEYAVTEVTPATIDKLYNKAVLDKLFDASPEFKTWFEKNHVTKQTYNKETKSKAVSYERLYVWNVIKPNNPDYYESTQITRKDGSTETIPGLPTLNFYARVVKKEFRTGYDPKTGEVRPIIGVHKDNRGDFLPKNIPGSPYINERYFQLKNAPEGSEDNKLFKVLQKITDLHLKYQEGVGKRGKLYMDFPRFEKSALELTQTIGVKKLAQDRVRGSSVGVVFNRMKDWFKGAKDTDKELNWKDENMLVRADAFDDAIENIPIQGLYNLTPEETSTDIISSMFRYMYGVENHKQLLKMNPVAQGLKKVLEDPNNHIKEVDKINMKNFLNRGVVTYMNKKGKYVRKEAFNNFYDREFMAQTTTGRGKDLAWLQNLQKFLFKRASFAFFALNIPSALKNAMGAKYQALIHSAGNNDISFSTLVKGEAWSAKYMTKLSFGGDLYARGTKSLEQQLGEVFDPIQGRFQEKFGESITRTLGKDVASMTWLYNFRKWTEMQASMQTFGAMMYKKKIKMGDKYIDYMDAWELNKDGKIQLKAGIDPTWGITYDKEGNQIIGEEFKKFKSRIHGVMNKLNGAYARFDQPEMQRYLAFRFISYLRRYFTTMAMNRFGKKRWNPGMGEIDEGYYVTAFKALAKLKHRNLHDLTAEDKVAWMKIMTEVGGVMIMGALISLWGWDDDDEERYAKLRERSGAMGFFGLTNESGEEFDFGGFLSLHTMSLLMQVRAENEQFIPFPSNLKSQMNIFTDLKSIAFGPTTDTYSQIFEDIGNWMVDSDAQFYKRRVGPYEWQEQGGRKLWAHIAKSFGFTGTSLDPAQAITNFQNAQARYK